MINNIENKKIFITGGAGFLGRHLVKRFYDNNEITVYSRDEAKHYYLNKEFPKVNCVIGDVRNLDLMKRASKGHDIGIFAASLKQIGAVDQNYEEGVKVIIDGAINSRRVAEENEMESACFISSDKSRAATTLYGSMKFVGGELFIVNPQTTTTNLSSAIYGNVFNSTGSIIPLIWDSIKKNYTLTLYSKEMTRFMLDIDDAVDTVITALRFDGFNVIPNLKSFLVYDLFEIYKEKFGLKYDLGKPRISEKLHELMISKEEIPRVYYSNDNDCYLMHYKNIYNQVKIPNNEFSSGDAVITISELDKLLKKYNYYENI